MNCFKPLLILSLVLASVPSFADRDDIGSPGADLYIRVTRDENLRQFQLCSKTRGIGSCRQLGHHRWYSLASLEHQRNIEIAQAAGSVVGTAAVTALSLLTVFGVTAFLVPVGSDVLFLSAEGLALSGTAAGAGAFTAGASLGPVEQLKQQYLLRSAVINDEQIVLVGKTDSDLTGIADRLNLLLNKIE